MRIGNATQSSRRPSRAPIFNYHIEHGGPWFPLVNHDGVPGWADTLVLSSGETFEGEYFGTTSEEVRFIVDGKLHQFRMRFRPRRRLTNPQRIRRNGKNRLRHRKGSVNRLRRWLQARHGWMPARNSSPACSTISM